MNSTPDKREGDESKTKSKSRREMIARVPEMPDCDAIYMVGYLIELGMTMGEQPITFGEIESWMELTGVELEPWESRFIKRLSEAYMGESHRARDPDAESPWTEAPYSPKQRSEVANRMKSAVRGIA